MRSIRLSRILFSVMCLGTAIPASSLAQTDALRLPAVFSDHMIVQREQPIRVWGWGAAGDTVHVTLADVSAEAVVADDGSWSAELPELMAGGPHTLTVAGDQTITFEDVLVGDVWLAGGQSNMEWPVIASNDADAEIASASFPRIRLFTVERAFAGDSASDVLSSGWQAVTPSSVRDFSAVAYFFGRELHQELNVPIGLLESNWGGSAAEAWMSPEGLAEHPDFVALADSIVAGSTNPQMILDRETARYERAMQRWNDRIRELDLGFQVEGPVWAQPAFRPTNWDTMAIPQAWEDGGLGNYDGIVWFRKAFEIPEDWTGRPLHLSIGIVDDSDSTWINGHLVGGSWQNGPRNYVIPPSYLRAGENVLTMRIVDPYGPGGIRGEAEDLKIWSENHENDAVSLAGDWTYQAVLRTSEMPRRPPRPAENQIPVGLYNAMIAPIQQFALKGVIWYQGETNAGRAYQYRTLFPALIQDWRNQFESPDLPFLYVQLANFMARQDDPDAESAWAELREAQTMTLQVPNTAMAVAIDVGEANDIHPRDKQSVGHRLALAALGTVYDRDVVYSGPQYVGMRIDGSSIRLLFAHTGSGLTARGGELRGFAIAGPDGEFKWADARIEDNMVVVRHPSVDDPRAVRYGWGNNPDVNLYNREGLPAIPFRTDDLPGETWPSGN